MKKEYQLSPEEFAEIKEISSQREPVLKMGNTWTGNGPQERANEFWKKVAEKYGFIWDSAEGISGKGPDHFKALPSTDAYYGLTFYGWTKIKEDIPENTFDLLSGLGIEIYLTPQNNQPNSHD